MVRGDLVQTWFDAGGHPSTAGCGLQLLFGIVEKCGPKTLTIRWESGLRNRVRRGRSSVSLIQDPELRAEARKKLVAHGK